MHNGHCGKRAKEKEINEMCRVGKCARLVGGKQNQSLNTYLGGRRRLDSGIFQPQRSPMGTIIIAHLNLSFFP
jgi:hypothetical protein